MNKKLVGKIAFFIYCVCLCSAAFCSGLQVRAAEGAGSVRGTVIGLSEEDKNAAIITIYKSDVVYSCITDTSGRFLIDDITMGD